MADIQKLKELIADWESTSDDIPFGLDEDDRVILEAMKFAADNHDIAARLEAAEERADNLNIGWLKVIEERDEARAQLAELEKQEPVACKKRLVNHRSGVEHPWTYHGKIDKACQGDIFRVEVVPLYTRAAPLTLPDAIDGSRVAHVYLDTMAADKLDAYVMGANDMLAKVKRLNGLEEKHDK